MDAVDFLQMFKAGLAYESNMPINCALHCKTGLANEEVVNGGCERCSTWVEQKANTSMGIKNNRIRSTIT